MLAKPAFIHSPVQIRKGDEQVYGYEQHSEQPMARAVARHVVAVDHSQSQGQSTEIGRMQCNVSYQY